MPINPTYPGVYVQEIPSGVRTIVGVSTSIAAFVDYFRQGPMDQAVQIFNMGDFEREFGGLDDRSEASYAIQQFFLNGGTEAYVVRAASGIVAVATVDINDAAISGALALQVEAISPGTWGNNLQMDIDYPEPVSANRFNLTVSQFEELNGQSMLVQTETFRNLSMIPTDADFIETVINDESGGSKLVRVTASGNNRPLQTGTLSGPLDPFPTISANPPQVDVTIGAEGPATATLAAVPVPTSLSDARGLLEAAIRAALPASRAFSQASVSIVDNRLRIKAGPAESDFRIVFAASGLDPMVSDLGLSPGTDLKGVLSGDISSSLPHGGGQLNVTIGGSGHTIELAAMNDLATAGVELQTQIRGADTSTEFTAARVVTHAESGVERLIVLAGVSGAAVSFTQEGSDSTWSELGLDINSAASITALLGDDLASVPTIAAGAMADVTIGSEGPHAASTGTVAGTLAEIALELQAAIRIADPDGSAEFTGARVAGYDSGGESRLVALTDSAGITVEFAAAPLDTTTVTELGLDAATAQANVQSYALGQGPAVVDTAQGVGVSGADGDPPDGLGLIGDLNAKTGIYALEDVDLFNILCLPRTATVSAVSGNSNLTATEATAVITAATDYCEKRRAMLLVDTPDNIDEVPGVKEWLDDNANLRHKNTGFYFPRVQIPDPLNGFRLRSVAASGTVAGLYARTDSSRGVWKAPAGTEANLTNVSQLDYTLSDPENGTLNPLAINCLRNFPVYGTVAWGARTLVGADQMASEWKYIPVRRLALYMEESLYRGLQWVVFEPNDEPLWSQIRLNVGAFMHNLFRQGAFQGQASKDAYFVKCDKETTTQNDINLGIVNIIVGFAPLKPAEFVILKLQQIAGQIET